MESNDLITVNKEEYERLILERDAAVEGFKGQFELAKQAIDENTKLREKVKDLDNILIKTHQAATDRINELEKDIQFFKNRQKFNTLITQELVELNDPRIVNILTKARIVQL
jgi:hypothetical protein